MARELLLTGDRPIIEVLAEIRAQRGDAPPVWTAIERLNLAVFENANAERMIKALVGVAAAAIATIVRIRGGGEP